MFAALLLCLPLLGAGLTPDLIRDLIPSSFPAQHPSNYTIRYLSQLNGSDWEGCLDSQPHTGSNSTADPAPAVQYCRTLRYALTGQLSGRKFYNIHDLILVVSPDIRAYSYNGSIEVRNSSDVIIAKDPSVSGEAIFMCDSFSDKFNNLFFSSVDNIALRGLTFTHCGPRSAGISMNLVTNARVYDSTFRDNLNAGIVIARGSDYIFRNNIFINNIQTGIIAALVSDVTFQDNLFENNTASSEYDFHPDLRFGYRRAGALSVSFENSTAHDLAYILIRNCTFRNNHAGISESNSTDAAQRPILYIPRGHGGALHVSFQNTTGHRVVVENCSFIRNSAKFTGGAISVLFYRGSATTGVVQSSSRNNTVRIDKTLFQDNVCSGNGGAISANAFEAANSSKVIVTNSIFQRNRASDKGGAFSFIIEDSIVINSTCQISNVPIIQASTFVRNESPHGGSAISLVSNARVEQAIDKAEISDCVFADNKAGYHSALLSVRYPISLKGSNVFKNNIGGAITLLQTQLDTSGSALFQNNTAEDGGAIKMVDESRFNLLEGVNVTFVGNHASRHGGAMKVVSSSIINDLSNYYKFYNSCFITYQSRSLISGAELLYNATVSYFNNTAERDGAAIYTTSLVICTRKTPNLKQEEENLQYINYYNNSLFLEPPFQFSDNVVTGRSRVVNSIATEPSYFTVTPLSLSGAPGQKLHMNIRAEGQSGNSQDALWSANFNQTGLFSLAAKGMYYSPIVEYQGSPEDEDVCTQPYEKGVELGVLSITRLDFSIVQTLAGTVVNTTSVSLNITCCNPGYVFLNTTCVIDPDPSLKDVIVRPDSDNKYLYTPHRVYARWRNGSLLWASIPVVFKNCASPFGSLPGCLFRYDDPDDQCKDNRTGFLCGKCPEGQVVDLTFSRCVECKEWHAFMIAAIVVAFAVVCTLVMIFNISVPNEMRGFLFYIQVVGFVYTNFLETETLVWDYYLSSVFGFSLYIPLCPYPGYDALYTAAFGIILPLTAIVTIVLYIISARFIKHLSNKNSFDGIWFLTFIIYKFVADTCFRILRCQKVNNGKPNEYVYYYDGDVQCFTSEDPTHLGFAIAALFLSVLIILFPICILVISFRRFQLTVNITDVLNKDLKHSCRWWASFDLFRRLLFIFVVLLSNYVWPLYSQLALLYSGLFVFFVFACAKPYSSKRANITEALVLADLLLVSAIFLSRDISEHKRLMPLALLLLLLPFLCATVYLVFNIIAFIWNKFSPTDFKTACTSLFCKMMKKIGIKIPFLPSVECVTIRPPLIKDLTLHEFEDNTIYNHDLFVAEGDSNISSSPYTQYREELLED